MVAFSSYQYRTVENFAITLRRIALSSNATNRSLSRLIVSSRGVRGNGNGNGTDTYVESIVLHSNMQ